jgi:hypothetical protein
VLTGDIVGSSKLNQVERELLPKKILGASETLQESFNCVPFQIRIFRGDSWQFIVSAPEKSLRVGLMFRSLIRNSFQETPLDTRIGIGIGSIHFLPEENLSSGDGEAFRRSGAALENMVRKRYLDGIFPERWDWPITELLREVLLWIDLQAQNWTPGQAGAVSGALLGRTQSGIAKQEFQGEITQQAVAQHLQRAGWAAVQSSVDLYERIIADLG